MVFKNQEFFDLLFFFSIFWRTIVDWLKWLVKERQCLFVDKMIRKEGAPSTSKL